MKALAIFPGRSRLGLYTTTAVKNDAQYGRNHAVFGFDMPSLTYDWRVELCVDRLSPALYQLFRQKEEEPSLFKWANYLSRSGLPFVFVMVDDDGDIKMGAAEAFVDYSWISDSPMLNATVGDLFQEERPIIARGLHVVVPGRGKHCDLTDILECEKCQEEALLIMTGSSSKMTTGMKTKIRTKILGPSS